MENSAKLLNKAEKVGKRCDKIAKVGIMGLAIGNTEYTFAHLLKNTHLFVNSGPKCTLYTIQEKMPNWGRNFFWRRGVAFSTHM